MTEKKRKNWKLVQDPDNQDTMWLDTGKVWLVFRDGSYVGWHKP